MPGKEDWERHLEDTGHFDSLAYSLDRRPEWEKHSAKISAEDSWQSSRVAQQYVYSAIDASFRIWGALQIPYLRWLYRRRWRRFTGTREQFLAKVHRELTVVKIAFAALFVLALLLLIVGH